MNNISSTVGATSVVFTTSLESLRTDYWDSFFYHEDYGKIGNFLAVQDISWERWYT